MARPTHIVAIPIPANGHINPMMNICCHLANRGIDITFVVPEAWKPVLSSDLQLLPPPNIQIRTIANVVPFNLELGADLIGFVKATRTKMEAPFEQLLDQLESPVHGILADTFFPWAVPVGERRNTRVFSFFTQSATVFNVFFHLDRLPSMLKLGVDLSERGGELIDYIPGIESSLTLADLPSYCFSEELITKVEQAMAVITKANCVVFTSFYELERNIMDYLVSNCSLPIYTVGPLIPSDSIQAKEDLPTAKVLSTNNEPEKYYAWLDSQPKSSVLLISFGTFFPVSAEQKEEVAMALRETKVRYLWVLRGSSKSFQLMDDDRGLVVSWCEQVKVLQHPSVGCFFTHCGWNSVLEAVYAGVPMLAFPMFSDQYPNSKLIADDLKIGLRLRRQTGKDILVERESIIKAINTIMNVDGGWRTEMQERTKRIQEICHASLIENGSSYNSLNSFVDEVIRQTN